MKSVYSFDSDIGLKYLAFLFNINIKKGHLYNYYRFTFIRLDKYFDVLSKKILETLKSNHMTLQFYYVI